MNGTKLLWILSMILLSKPGWAESAETTTCGTKLGATVQERIDDCKKLNDPKGLMTLVMIDQFGNKILKDQFDVLWGDRRKTGGADNDGYFTFDKAKSACSEVTEKDGYPSIPGVTWRLPTPKEFARIGREDQRYYNEEFSRGGCCRHESIEGDKSWQELPNMLDYWFWTSLSFDHFFAWVFFGVDGCVYDYYGDNDSYLSVRCVASR